MRYNYKKVATDGDPPSPDLIDNDQNLKVNEAFAYCLEEARLPTTGGSDLESKKCVGQVSALLRFSRTGRRLII